MSGKKESPGIKKEVGKLLNDILNFGPAAQNIPTDFSYKIRQIIKKLQEISRRIDNLASRL